MLSSPHLRLGEEGVWITPQKWWRHLWTAPNSQHGDVDDDDNDDDDDVGDNDGDNVDDTSVAPSVL